MTRWASTEELCLIAGVSRWTLRRWVKRGLLPEPRRFCGGHQKGVVALYPSWTRDRVREIDVLRDKYTLDELADKFGAKEKKKNGNQK